MTVQEKSIEPSLWQQENKLVITTDASRRGLGSPHPSNHGQGNLESEDNSYILRELSAVWESYQSLVSLVRTRHVKILLNNVTMVHYLNEQEGSKTIFHLGR